MGKINKILPFAAGGCFIGAAVIRIVAFLIDYGRLYVDFYAMLYLFGGLVALLALVDKKASFAMAGFSIIMAFAEARYTLSSLIYTFVQELDFEGIMSSILNTLEVLGYLLAAGYILFTLSKPDSFISKLWFVPAVILLVVVFGGVILNIESIFNGEFLEIIAYLLFRVSIMLLLVGIGASCMNVGFKNKTEEVEEV